MKSTLILTAPLLRTNANRTNAIAAAIANSAAELERDVKEHIQRSIPTGRTYRRTPIVRKASRRNSGLKLRQLRRPGGSLLVVGYTFHRASRAGQPPAIDSGRLINSIRGMRISQFRHRVNVGVDYGLPLDDPDGLNRPFFTVRVEKFRPVFFENVRRATLGLK